ncbi:MAG: aminoacyl-tRNA hydrolase [Alphaproteobacteria bacterium]|nr:aminoacyl-tRNA hydrolase [Alphaproteobacteria bacterium]
MLLLVGLGNPGNKYADNRHNIGFMAVDEIVRRHDFAVARKRFQGLLCEGKLGGQKVLALKPQTFMNESGRSVGEAARFYKLSPDQIVVIHDELDLAPGKLRVKRGGGLAGHNGLRSLAAHIGKDFRRIRLGVGHPGDKGKVLSHVLRDFAKADDAWLDPLLAAMAQAAALLVRDDSDSAFASKVALILKPPTHKPKPETPEIIEGEENQSSE